MGEEERTKKLIAGEKVFLDWKRERTDLLSMIIDTGMVIHMTNHRLEVRYRQRSVYVKSWENGEKQGGEGVIQK